MPSGFMKDLLYYPSSKQAARVFYVKIRTRRDKVGDVDKLVIKCRYRVKLKQSKRIGAWDENRFCCREFFIRQA